MDEAQGKDQLAGQAAGKNDVNYAKITRPTSKYGRHVPYWQ